MKKMSIAMILLSIILLVSACAGGSNGGNGAPGNNGSSNTETNAGNSGNSGNAENAGNGNEAPADGKTYKIGISQYLEHPSLDDTREGFLAALKDAGIEEGVNLEVDYHTAQADSTNNLSIAQQLTTGDYDLLLGIATPSATALAAAVNPETPLLFAAVTDPLDAMLVEDVESPGANITGAADFNPESIEMLMNFVAEHFPNVQNIGIVMNNGEPNSVVMADAAEAALAEHGIGLIRKSITNTSEVQQAAQSLVGDVDAFYITLDNSVVSGVNAILQIAEAEGIPLFAADRNTVEAGAVAAVGFKYTEHGYQAGEMAVDILKNGANPAEMPVLYPQNLDLILNLPAAERQGVTITDDMKSVVQNPEDNLIEE